MGISYLSTFKDSEVIDEKSWLVTSLAKRRVPESSGTDIGHKTLKSFVQSIGQGKKGQEIGPLPVLRLLPRKDWKTPPCLWDT